MRVRCYQWIGRTYPNVYTNAAGSIVVPAIGGANVVVSFEELPTAQILVEVQATVLEDIEPGVELMRYLAWNATGFNIGAMSLRSDEQGSWLEFSYAVFGETLTQHLVVQVVSLVADTMNYLVPRLQPRFGGRPPLPACPGGIDVR